MARNKENEIERRDSKISKAVRNNETQEDVGTMATMHELTNGQK